MAILRILPTDATLALHDVAATRAIERAAMATLPPHTLMERAGEAVARLALAVAPHATRIWIAAGPGNNGGDGLHAAVRLRAAGRRVRVTVAGDLARLPDDARDASERAQMSGVPIADADAAWLASLGRDDLAIDALLGIGATRAPEGRVAEAVTALGRVGCPILAVDLPTGLDADTGRPLGDSPVRADHTLALLTLKPGLFTAYGRDACGVPWLDDLGIDFDPHTAVARLGGSDAMAPWTRPRRHATHKGSYGDVAIVGGAAGMTGAALLAARAASMAGAGRVFIDLLDGGSVGVDMQRPELMFRPGWSLRPETPLAASTVVAGCGGGPAIVAALPRLLSAAQRLVLDADALNAIAADAALQALLAARRTRRRGTILTPHPLEAARLLGTDAAAVQRDRVAAAATLAERSGCTVLLKGSGSVIADPGAPPTINSTGNAALASAGTGDVLAGAIGGLWSALAAGSRDDPAGSHRVAVAAAWLHGVAADATTASGPVCASDLIERMAQARDAVAARR